ncbi:hypothetical protein DERF_014397 [Dermatophagoides farinae]|uniref:Uncharacterized protein n=1 Tax=Dermatophagoides farinae TaxID=6954 RepID=A0A922HMU5_DERFA|nr:hypothetical protein DERF_014397 [Dermatophagoides farinae]
MDALKKKLLKDFNSIVYRIKKNQEKNKILQDYMIFIDNLNRYVNQTKWSQFSVGEERWQALSCYVEKNQSNASSSSEIIDQAKLLETQNCWRFSAKSSVGHGNEPPETRIQRPRRMCHPPKEIQKRIKNEGAFENLSSVKVYVDTIDPNEYEYDRKNVCQILYVPVATIKDENMSPNCAKEKPKIPIITLSSDDDNGDNKESIDQNQNEQKKEEMEKINGQSTIKIISKI